MKKRKVIILVEALSFSPNLKNNPINSAKKDCLFKLSLEENSFIKGKFSGESFRESILKHLETLEDFSYKNAFLITSKPSFFYTKLVDSSIIDKVNIIHYLEQDNKMNKSSDGIVETRDHAIERIRNNKDDYLIIDFTSLASAFKNKFTREELEQCVQIMDRTIEILLSYELKYNLDIFVCGSRISDSKNFIQDDSFKDFIYSKGKILNNEKQDRLEDYIL